jgi:hypothetical protein
MTRNKINIKHMGAGLVTGLALLALGSCQKDFTDNGLHTDLSPSFTMKPVAGRTNTYLFKNTTPGAMNTRWDFDNGSGFAIGKFVDTIFYPDAGTYAVKMQSMGKGGLYYDAASQTVNIATSDPNAGNLVEGSKMNAADASKWTIMTISSGVTMEMKEGVMVATGGGWGHAAFWQKLTVVAGKKYRFGMTVAGSGASDTWAEVYFGTTQPVAGSDYSAGGNQIGLNTWAGCGNVPFSGNIATIGCSGAISGKNGEITFAASGNVYLLVKAGGANLGTTGISFDNIALRGI